MDSGIRMGVSGKRIAFLFAHLHKGGMQKAVSNISCALPESYQQYVIYFGSDNPGFTYNAKEIDLKASGAMRTGAAHKAANFVRRVRRLQEFIDSERLDTVVSFGEAANVLNALTRRKRTVLSVRVSLEEGLAQTGRYGGAYRLLIRSLYRKADLVVPVSQALAEQLQHEIGVPEAKLKVIYNLYDLEKIRRLAQEPTPSQYDPLWEQPTVVSVGSLIYQKGHEHLIRGFAAAKKRLAALQLLLIGEGELEGRLRALASELGVESSVHFVGFDSNPYRYMARAQVFVLPSRFEGFPNVLAEAMICGAPVIATDCKTGPREILGESAYGVLLPNVREDNREAVEAQLAAAILGMLESQHGERFRRLSLERSEDFSSEHILGKWLEAL